MKKAFISGYFPDPEMLNMGIYCPEDGAFLNTGIERVRITVPPLESLVADLFYCRICDKYYMNVAELPYEQDYITHRKTLRNINCQIYRKSNKQQNDSVKKKAAIDNARKKNGEHLRNHIKKKLRCKTIETVYERPTECAVCKKKLDQNDGYGTVSVNMASGKKYEYRFYQCSGCKCATLFGLYPLDFVGDDRDDISDVKYKIIRWARRNRVEKTTKMKKSIQHIREEVRKSSYDPGAWGDPYYIEEKYDIGRKLSCKRTHFEQFNLDCYYIGDYNPLRKGEQDG